MDVPGRMVQVICDHVFSVVSHTGPDLDLATLSRQCGELMVREAQLHPGELLAYMNSLNDVIAWAERFGKHLGIFFLTEKEN